tara:strand:+ start:327 stop:6206 length:5880 start_codon:yes stop_codon:yes gene_type:complete
LAIKRYPPSFDKNKKYPPQYDLENIDVFLESPVGDYFNISGLPSEIGFGKHAFSLYVTEPLNGLPLKDYGNILIEAKDAAGTLIWSGVTQHSDISGAAVCYIWVKQDPLRTEKNIIDGTGTLTIVGQLSNVPNQYRDVYNLRTTIPLNIRKSFSNLSPLFFQSSSLIQSTLAISEQLEADIDNANFNRSYADITIKNLETYGGQVDSIQISYLESGSLSTLTDNDYTFLTQHTIQTTSASFEDEIDFKISEGLNPTSQSFRVLMPPMANQSGSDFGLDNNKFKFKFEFLNKNNEKAKAVTTNTDLIITSSWIEFAGPATVITGEDNLIAGQMFIGNSVGDGIEVSGQSSAFLRSIGYLGFNSASAGSGSGFMLYSGSVLGANTDEYSNGGIGFEFVQDSSSYMKFGSANNLFDIRAKTFFVGSETTQFISGSSGKVEISSSKFHLKPDGSVTMSGQLAVEAGGTIGGFTISDDALSTDTFILSSSQVLNDPVSFISSSAFKVSAAGKLTASEAYIAGAVITGSTGDFKSIVARGVSIGGSGDTTEGQISTTQVTASVISASSTLLTGELTASSLDVTGTSTFDGAVTFNGDVGAVSSSKIISASRIHGELGATFNGNVIVNGDVKAENYITEEITIITSEGSTRFGDTQDDRHEFTGSLEIHHTGSIGFHLTGSDARVDGNISASGYVAASSLKGISPSGGDLIDIVKASNSQIIVGDSGLNNPLILNGNLCSIQIGPDINESYAGGTPGDNKITFSTQNSYFYGKAMFGGINTDSRVLSDTLTVAGSYSGSGDLKISNGTNTLHYDVSRHAISSSGATLDFMGTDFSFNTNDLFIDQSTSRIGIGTTSPTTTLEVVGDISASGVVYASRFEASGSGTAIDIVDNLDITGALTASAGISASGHIVTTRGIKSKEIDANGDLTLHKLNAGTRNIVFKTDGDSSGDMDAAITLGSSEDLTIRTQNDGGDIEIKTTNFDDAIYIDDSTQRVGIGTNVPGDKFTVAGNISSSGVGIFSSLDISGNIDVDGTTNLDVVDIDGNVDVAGTLTLNNTTTTTDYISSPFYQSGFAGTGWRIESGSEATSLTVDDLTVRGNMSVYELLIHQIRATNGNLFISNTGKIISASITNTSEQEFKLFFDTGSGYGHSFRPGDLIRAQRWQPDANGSGSQVYKSDLAIISVTDTTSSIARLTGSMDAGSTDIPQAGYEYVRIGNYTTSSRQGSIYMTADDGNAPFIDVVDDVTKHSEFGSKVKTRIGRLSGITSTTFPSIGTGLDEYGFYASGSAFLEGGINATKGSIGNWYIGTSVISSSNITLDSTNQKITIQNTTFGNAGVQLEYAGSKGKFSAGDGSNKFIKFDGTRATIKSDNFELDSSGNITASDALLSGKLTSTEGAIGGFTINDTSLSSTNFTLSASSVAEELFISHSSFKVKNTGQITASALFLTGSGGSNYLQYKNGTLTVRGDVAATTISTPSASINADGYLSATSGSIADWIIDGTNGTLTGGNIVLDSNSDNGIIAVGSGVSKTAGDGVYIDGNGNFRVGDFDGDRIHFDGSSLNITSSKVDISGSKVILGAPRFLLGDNTNYISGSNGNLKIVTGDATLSGSSVDILTNNFYFGGETNYISGSSDGIKLVATNTTLSGSSVDIKTPKFLFGTPSGEFAQFISGANGNIEISSSKFHLQNDGDLVMKNMTASNANIQGILSSSQGDIGGFKIGLTSIESNQGTLKLKSNGQITASAVSMSGTIVTDDIDATGGTIGGFTLNTTSISASNLFMKSSGQITGSDVLFDGGEIGGFSISSNELSASGLILRTAQRFTDGQITSSNVLFDGGKIGGFNISDSVLSIDNIKLSSVEKGLVISSSQGTGKVKLSSGSLSDTTGTATSLINNGGFEEDTDGDTGQDVKDWGVNSSTIAINSTNQYFLWNSGSIKVNVTASNPAAGNRCFQISVQAEQGSGGGGLESE